MGLIVSSFSSLYQESGKSRTDDMDMDGETVEEQIAATAQGTGLDENEDEHGSGSETRRDNTSTHWSLTDFPLTTERQGVFWDSAGAEESLLSELVDVDGIYNTTHDDTEDRITNDFPDGHASETLDTPAQTTADRDANPSASQGHDVFASLLNQISSSTLNPNLDQAREPERTPPTSDSEETESEEESDETSDLTEHPLEEDPDELSDTTEHPVEPAPDENNNNNTVDLQPFNFPACPANVRQLILRHALHTDAPIKPYWSLGALEVPAHTCRKPNHPTVVAAFAGARNRDLADQAATILYGENVFDLASARVALWWLRRIGPGNAARLRYLVVTVHGGVSDAFGTRVETLWRKFFDRLFLLPREGQQGPKPRLTILRVSFEHWTLETSKLDGLGPRDRPVWEPRHVILRTLFGLRGLERAVVVPGPFVSEYCADTLEAAMVMEPGETDDDVEACVGGLTVPGGRYSFA